jgi:hypothetical protein
MQNGCGKGIHALSIELLADYVNSGDEQKTIKFCDLRKFNLVTSNYNFSKHYSFHLIIQNLKFRPA